MRQMNISGSETEFEGNVLSKGIKDSMYISRIDSIK